MKAGVVTSTVLHTAVLTWGLWSLSSPEPLDVSYSEALPVEIVMSENFQGVQGEKEAPITEKPAPKPTTRPQTLPMEAQNVGDNETDLPTPPTPDKTRNQTPQTGAPKPSARPEAEPQPAEKPQEVAEVPPPPKQPEPTPEPPKETAKPEAPKEPTPEIDPLAEAIAAAEKEPVKEAPKEPDPAPKNVPVPQLKPKAPKPTQVAEAKPETPKKPADKPSTKKKPETSQEDAPDSQTDFEAMAAAVINKQKAAGGGAKRSTETASLGSKKTTGATLSRGEKDALSEQLNGCWQRPAGLESEEGLRTVVTFNLTPDGHLEGSPSVDSSSGNRAFDESALRAVRKCNSEGFQLPSNNGEGWDTFKVNFDPEDMGNA
ncbi:cell envelope integrity protein TolA [Mangrovicella endophytica]|uniref:cell envelope integrity protein TolA n=1 Tax=Mangrovicella endophytica TaxID=2066697 RepID=UPI000C9E3985|nr:cell envelope integrity protein TolA [Mangrovicella endophytica]